MSKISDKVKSASVQAQTQLGDTFEIVGIGLFIGVFNELTEEVSPEDVGYKQDTKFIIVATRSQFAQPPETYQEIKYNGDDYYILSVSKDSLHYKIEVEQRTV